MTVPRLARLPFMVAALAALLAGLWAGLVRAGWVLPLAPAPLLLVHGPLMVGGFLGTLIGLERAVALGRAWALSVPALTAAGTIALLAGAPPALAALLLCAASGGLGAVFAVIVYRQPALFTATMAAGAVAWLVGNALWLAGRSIAEVVSWWAGFLVLTIAGERLELTRVLPTTRGRQLAFAAIVALLFAALALGGLSAERGARVLGVAFLCLTLWLARYDVARRTIRQAGLPRYTASCLLSGYFWLGASGVLAVCSGAVVAGPRYDAVLHALFVGFVLAMVFGHAPIVMPAVFGVPVPLRRSFYAALGLLHLSLALRLLGDLVPLWLLRQWGALANTLAVLAFFATVARAALQGRRARRVSP